MTRLFLTGGSAFIGGEIVKLATAQGHEAATSILRRHTFPSRSRYGSKATCVTPRP